MSIMTNVNKSNPQASYPIHVLRKECPLGIHLLVTGAAYYFFGLNGAIAAACCLQGRALICGTSSYLQEKGISVTNIVKSTLSAKPEDRTTLTHLATTTSSAQLTDKDKNSTF